MLNGKMIKFQLIKGTTIDVDNIASIVTTHGPGTARLFQAGSKDPLAEPVPKEKSSPATQADGAAGFYPARMIPWQRTEASLAQRQWQKRRRGNEIDADFIQGAYEGFQQGTPGGVSR